jgi:hypothetical protein
MFVTVAISAALSIITIIMGYLGVHLTMHPAESQKARVRYKLGFASCAVAVVALVIWQGVRNTQSQSSLETQIRSLKDQLAHSHIHFDTNPVVSVPDPTKFKVPTTMKEIFAANKMAEFNVGYQNIGASITKRTGGFGEVIVTAKRPDLDQLFSMVATQFKDGWTGDELVPQDRRFFTVRSRILTLDEINELDRGVIGLYLIATVRFSDATGDYQQDFCSWLQLPARELVWHGCGIHESEIKLH